MRNVLFVISGPSGVGKGTLVKLLLQERKDLSLSISCTTRAPREGEVHGREYFFLTREEFLARRESGDFLEWDEHFGNFYGTPKSFVSEQLKQKSVVLEIDVVGGLNARASFAGSVPVVLIMVAPPDPKTLEARLAGRCSEDEAARKARLARTQFELDKAREYDYTIVNGDLEETKQRLFDIIDQEINKE